MNKKFKIYFLFLMLTTILQAQVSEYEYKAAFIERFTRFVEWPQNVDHNHPDSTFKIVVIGKNYFNSGLNDLFSAVKVKNHSAELIFSNDFNDLTKADLVFISGSEKKRLKEIVNVIATKPILVISDSRGFCEMGTHINMYVDDDYIRYEINQKALEKAGLKVSSLLLASAKIVKTDE